MNIFIDADAFIALLNSNDTLHTKAQSLLKKLAQQKKRSLQLYTSWDVIDEVATKISYYLTKKQALAFFDYLEKMQTNIVYIDLKIAKKAQVTFKKIISKKISMTDCSNVEIIKQLKLDYVFSFDKIYQKQELVLLDSLQNNKSN